MMIASATGSRFSSMESSVLGTSHSFNHESYKKEARFLFQPSFATSCVCKRLNLRRPPNMSAILLLKNNFASNTSVPTTGDLGQFQQLRVSKNGFGGSHYNQTLFRSIVARFKNFEIGAHGAAYSTSEFQQLSKIRAICFYAITAITSMFLFTLMVLAHPFVLLLDGSRRQFHHFVAKLWAILSLSPFYKVEFVGLENLPAPETPAVYVSNHQSFLDIYILLMLGRSFKFISKTAIFLFPIIGWAMFMMGVIPLKRLDSKSQLECLKRCMDLIKKGVPVFFFPEGTRSRDGKLGHFKKGAFSVAAKTNVAVVPITLVGTGKAMGAGMEGMMKRGALKVVIHRPICGVNADVLCHAARSIIADSLNKV